MFSLTFTSGRPRPPWRETVRRAVDLAVAFATLESYELPPRAPHSVVDPTLRAPRSADPARTPHAHRTPLRAPRRPRRPGRVVPRAQPCVAREAARAARRRHAPERAH
jgi:hypothetical protein